MTLLSKPKGLETFIYVRKQEIWKNRCTVNMTATHLLIVDDSGLERGSRTFWFTLPSQAFGSSTDHDTLETRWQGGVSISCFVSPPAIFGLVNDHDCDLYPKSRQFGLCYRWGIRVSQTHPFYLSMLSKSSTGGSYALNHKFILLVYTQYRIKWRE